jgi:hypothetical protein
MHIKEQNYNVFLTGYVFVLSTVTCRGLRVTYRWILDCMIGFIDTLYNSRYSHALQFNGTHALQFSVFTSRTLKRIYNDLTVTSNLLFSA